jgi:hypothetical protein
MAFLHALQASRYELKYILGESYAQGVRDFVSPHLEPDPHARPDRGNTYVISSLYLDTPDLQLYRQTCQGIKNRFKLRIRFYDDDPDHPAFLEIKRRVTDVIRKERATVTRGAVRRVLRGDPPDMSFLMGDVVNPKSGSALLNFCGLCDRIGAIGQVYVSYLREAYVSPDSDSIRVTFDRQLSATRYKQGADLAVPTDGIDARVGGVILELKFTDRFPPWMREVVGEFNLMRSPAAKYMACVNAIGMGDVPKESPELALGVVR